LRERNGEGLIQSDGGVVLQRGSLFFEKEADESIVGVTIALRIRDV
jgi:hypothetical protein